MRESGMFANVITFSVVLSACEKGRQLQQSFASLHKMRANGMVAKAISFNALTVQRSQRAKWEPSGSSCWLCLPI